MSYSIGQIFRLSNGSLKNHYQRRSKPHHSLAFAPVAMIAFHSNFDYWFNKFSLRSCFLRGDRRSGIRISQRFLFQGNIGSTRCFSTPTKQSKKALDSWVSIGFWPESSPFSNLCILRTNYNILPRGQLKQFKSQSFTPAEQSDRLKNDDSGSGYLRAEASSFAHDQYCFSNVDILYEQVPIFHRERTFKPINNRRFDSPEYLERSKKCWFAPRSLGSSIKGSFPQISNYFQIETFHTNMFRYSIVRGVRNTSITNVLTRQNIWKGPKSADFRPGRLEIRKLEFCSLSGSIFKSRHFIWTRSGIPP